MVSRTGIVSRGRFALQLRKSPEEALLPPNLTNFTISLSPNLKSLNGKGFQPLTSLKHLTIWYCDNLDCLPEDVLPTSLCDLVIYGCPLLKERYGNEKGRAGPRLPTSPKLTYLIEL